MIENVLIKFYVNYVQVWWILDYWKFMNYFVEVLKVCVWFDDLGWILGSWLSSWLKILNLGWVLDVFFKFLICSLKVLYEFVWVLEFKESESLS